ncbi:MAG: peptidoglycan DD-metalloendopeptidase family protein [Turicibacter sp.]|nr:peptidoglycan DD-metalloendopeptidase family protein [Turicibacter sp.]
MKQRISLLILAFVMMATSLHANARTIQQMQEEQREIRNEAQEARGYLAVTQAEVSALEAEIAIIDAQINEVSESLERVNNALIAAQEDLFETEIALEVARDDLDDQFDRLKTRLRAMYMNGPLGYLDVILQATSFTDFLTRVDRMNRIARSDREMMDRLRIAEQEVADRLEETFVHMTRIEGFQLQHTERLLEFEFAVSAKEDFMTQLESEARTHEISIRALEQADREITAAIQQAQEEEEARRRAAAAQEAARRAQQQVRLPQGGTLLWPVPGRFTVSSPYGNRTHPISRRPEFHTGIDIPAPGGTNILAAESGTVILSRWNGGYGNTIVIDHGNGMSTLYAHASRLLVSEGTWVNRGDVIALVGSTGVSTGNHLHFEVRLEGRHTNPAPFLGI